MAILKEKISVTISADLAQLLTEMAETSGIPKSQIVEKSLQQMVNERMEADAIKTAQIIDEDMPTEDEWLNIQSKLPRW